MTHRVPAHMNFGDLKDIMIDYAEIYGIDVFPNIEEIMVTIIDFEETEVTNELLREIHERDG